MANTIVIGMQWGDEGKGKDIDILSAEHDVIVRYQGGCNAGHTVVIGNERYALHTVPSGILRKGKINILGNNVVIDPYSFIKEVKDLRYRGLWVGSNNLKVSSSVHLTLEYHKRLEAAVQKEKIGTTGKGIGPTYEDKAARRGIRLYDLHNPQELEEKIEENTQFYNRILTSYNEKRVEGKKILEELLQMRADMLMFADDAIWKTIEKHNGSLLFESAQGTLLDIDHGTYPFVTSSNSTIGGAYTGTGTYINFDRRIGIVKAYTTRVGEGPFPTEQENEIGERLRKKGNEFGTTTGRPRRCGWLDLVAVSHAARINGINEISLTKLDVLDEEETIKVCTTYTYNGRTRKEFPPAGVEHCMPNYEELPGWQQDTSNARRKKDLPKNALEYIRKLEQLLSIPIRRVGVGQERGQTIQLH